MKELGRPRAGRTLAQQQPGGLMHHAPFLLDSQYRLYSLSVLSFFICHCQGLSLPCTTNVISCQYLTLDRVGIEPTTFQSADQASNHYTVDTTGYTLLLCKADMHRSGSRTQDQVQGRGGPLQWFTAAFMLSRKRCPGQGLNLGPCGHGAEALLNEPPSHVRSHIGSL